MAKVPFQTLESKEILLTSFQLKRLKRYVLNTYVNLLTIRWKTKLAGYERLIVPGESEVGPTGWYSPPVLPGNASINGENWNFVKIFSEIDLLFESLVSLMKYPILVDDAIRPCLDKVIDS